MDKHTELKNLTFDALAGVVNAYPWFGAAQKLLCEKMAGIGGEGWGMTQYCDAAIHVTDRSRISSLLREHRSHSDKDVTEILKKYITEKEPLPQVDMGMVNYRGVGDYFSVEQYASVRRTGDDSLRGFKASEEDVDLMEMVPDFGNDFCTETLAQIYAEQGYYKQARDIYIKLSLADPEKNVYFAALIEKLNSEIKN